MGRRRGLKEAVTSLDHRPGEGQRPQSRTLVNPNFVNRGRWRLGLLRLHLARLRGHQRLTSRPSVGQGAGRGAKRAWVSAPRSATY